MTVIAFTQERRTKRSNHTYRAITYQLEHIFKVHGLRNFTLSDSNGLILAQAGHYEESEAVAAYAPVLAKCTDRDKRAHIVHNILQFIPESIEYAVEVRSFFLDGERLFLGILGHGEATAGVAMHKTLTGIRRIYTQNLHTKPIYHDLGKSTL